MTENTYQQKPFNYIMSPEIRKDMETIYFSSDFHFNHDKIIDICNRPCTRETHEEWLLNSINNVVDRKHTLYILGDVSMANKNKTERFIDKIKCKQKHLIKGNHDNSIHNSTRFESINDIKDFTYSKFGLNIHIVLCHYSLLSWNRSVHGSWNLFGHSHCRPLEYSPRYSFDVGIDRPEHLWRPYSLYEIYQIMYYKSLDYSLEDIFNELNKTK